MTGKLFAAALAAALLCANGALAADAQDCALKQIASLPITTLPDGNIAVPVSVNGKDHAFLVSLVDPLPGISEGLADQENMKRQPLPGNASVQFNGSAISGNHFTRVTEQATFRLHVGAIDSDATLPIIPDWSKSYGADGIISSTQLGNYDVEFDFKNAKMMLYSPEHCPGKIVYWADSYATAPLAQTPNGMTITQVSLDGKIVNAGLDVSPAPAHLELGIASILTGISADTLKVNRIEPHEGFSNGAWRYPFKTVSIGGIAIENPEINLVDGEFCKTPNTQWPPETGTLMKNLCAGNLWLGLNELRKLHLYFSFKENKLYVTAADAHK